jgi:hypothetical protein
MLPTNAAPMYPAACLKECSLMTHGTYLVSEISSLPNMVDLPSIKLTGCFTSFRAVPPTFTYSGVVEKNLMVLSALNLFKERAVES